MPAVRFSEICLAVYYWGAFTATWLNEREGQATELRRRRWLERHMIERAKVAAI